MIETDNPNRRRYFQQIESAQAIQVLQQLAEAQADVILVTREKSKQPADAPIRDDVPPKQNFNFKITQILDDGRVDLDPQLSFFKKIGLVKLTGLSMIFQAHLGQVQYLGIGTFTWDEGRKTYTFSPDLRTFSSCQQRLTYRIEARPPEIKINFTIDGQSIQGADLSGGGCSFFARGEFAKKFVPQKEFEKVTIQINSLEMVIPRAEVVAVKKQSGSVSNDTAKVAFRFLDLPEKLEEQLCQYINILAGESTDRFAD
jgi:hypothetical protein